MRAEQQYIDLFARYEELVCRHSTPVMNALRAGALADFEPPDCPEDSPDLVLFGT